MKLAIRKLAMWIGAVSIAALAPLAQAGLVTDGGFEIPGTVPLNNPPAFAHWVDSGGTVRSTTTFHSGPSSAEVQGQGVPGKLESLKQELSGLNSVFSYTLEFWVKCVEQSTTGPTTCDTDVVDVFLGTTLLNRSAPLAATFFGSDGGGAVDNGFFRYFGTVTPGIAGLAFLDFQSAEYPRTVFIDDVVFEAAACNPNCNVPEPGSLLLVGVALTAGAIVRRRRQR